MQDILKYEYPLGTENYENEEWMLICFSREGQIDKGLERQ